MQLILETDTSVDLETKMSAIKEQISEKFDHNRPNESTGNSHTEKNENTIIENQTSVVESNKVTANSLKEIATGQKNSKGKESKNNSILVTNEISSEHYNKTDVSNLDENISQATKNIAKACIKYENNLDNKQCPSLSNDEDKNMVCDKDNLSPNSNEISLEKSTEHNKVNLDYKCPSEDDGEIANLNVDIKLNENCTFTKEENKKLSLTAKTDIEINACCLATEPESNSKTIVSLGNSSITCNDSPELKIKDPRCLMNVISNPETKIEDKEPDNSDDTALPAKDTNLITLSTDQLIQNENSTVSTDFDPSAVLGHSEIIETTGTLITDDEIVLDESVHTEYNENSVQNLKERTFDSRESISMEVLSEVIQSTTNSIQDGSLSIDDSKKSHVENKEYISIEMQSKDIEKTTDPMVEKETILDKSLHEDNENLFQEIKKTSHQNVEVDSIKAKNKIEVDYLEHTDNSKNLLQNNTKIKELSPKNENAVTIEVQGEFDLLKKNCIDQDTVHADDIEQFCANNKVIEKSHEIEYASSMEVQADSDLIKENHAEQNAIHADDIEKFCANNEIIKESQNIEDDAPMKRKAELDFPNENRVEQDTVHTDDIEQFCANNKMIEKSHVIGDVIPMEVQDNSDLIKENHDEQNAIHADDIEKFCANNEIIKESQNIEDDAPMKRKAELDFPKETHVDRDTFHTDDIEQFCANNKIIEKSHEIEDAIPMEVQDDSDLIKETYKEQNAIHADDIEKMITNKDIIKKSLKIEGAAPLKTKAGLDLLTQNHADEDTLLHAGDITQFCADNKKTEKSHEIEDTVPMEVNADSDLVKENHEDQDTVHADDIDMEVQTEVIDTSANQAYNKVIHDGVVKSKDSEVSTQTLKTNNTNHNKEIIDSNLIVLNKNDNMTVKNIEKDKESLQNTEIINSITEQQKTIVNSYLSHPVDKDLNLSKTNILESLNFEENQTEEDNAKELNTIDNLNNDYIAETDKQSENNCIDLRSDDEKEETCKLDSSIVVMDVEASKNIKNKQRHSSEYPLIKSILTEANEMVAIENKVNEIIDLDKEPEEVKTSKPANETAKPPRKMISGLSNTLDILSDDDEDDEDSIPKSENVFDEAADTKREPKKSREETELQKSCDIKLDNSNTEKMHQNKCFVVDDDVMVIDEDSQDDKSDSNDKAEEIDKMSNNCKEETKAEITEDLPLSPKKVQEIIPHPTTTGEKPTSPTPTIEKPNKLLPENILKTAKKSISDMTREDLEEFCLEKIAEAIIDRNNLGEIKTKLKLIMQNVEDWKKKSMMLTKQNKDLQIVLKAIEEEVKKKTNPPIKPLKISRSVGMQVLITENDKVPKKRPPPKMATNPVNQTQPTSGPSKVSKPTQIQQIPVPILVPANARSPAKPVLTPKQILAPANANKNVNIANATAKSLVNRPAEKRPLNNNNSDTMCVDLTDDEPPPKQQATARNAVQAPVRVVAQHQLIAPRQQFNQTMATGSRKVYIPINSSAQRPSYVMKGVPITNNMPPRPRTGSNVMRMSNPNNLGHARMLTKLRHPAPLPSIGKQAMSGLKAIPPAPDLKISKVENGIVISWKIEGYQEDSYEEIASYQLFAYQETQAPPNTSLWKKIGDVKALPLPMACTLTQFMAGFKYYFAVRAVDVRSRLGPFSLPGSILLLTGP